MKSHQTTEGLGIAIGAVVLLAIALFAWMSGVFVPSPTSSPTSSPISSTTGPSSAGAIDYTINPGRITRNPAGKLIVEVEVVRKDASKWKSVSVANIFITGQTTAKLISALPTDPIPERFVLKFESDAIDSNGAKQPQLHFDLEIKAAKHLGLSGGSSQKSHHIPFELLELMEPAGE